MLGAYRMSLEILGFVLPVGGRPNESPGGWSSMSPQDSSIRDIKCKASSNYRVASTRLGLLSDADTHEAEMKRACLATTCRIRRSVDNDVHGLAASSRTADGQRHRTDRRGTIKSAGRQMNLGLAPRSWDPNCERGCCEFGALKGDRLTFHGSLSVHAARRCDEVGASTSSVRDIGQLSPSTLPSQGPQGGLADANWGDQRPRGRRDTASVMHSIQSRFEGMSSLRNVCCCRCIAG